MAARRKRPKYHHGDLRRALVEAALAILAKEGARGLSLREVARKVGVTQTAPYHHFPTREALLAAVAAEGFAGLVAELEASAERAAPWGAFEVLAAIGAGYVRFAVGNPEKYRVMMGGAIGSFVPYPELVTVAQRAFTILNHAVGAAYPPEIPPRRFDERALAVWAAAHGTAMLWIDGPIQG